MCLRCGTALRWKGGWEKLSARVSKRSTVVDLGTGGLGRLAGRAAWRHSGGGGGVVVAVVAGGRGVARKHRDGHRPVARGIFVGGDAQRVGALRWGALSTRGLAAEHAGGGQTLRALGFALDGGGLERAASGCGAGGNSWACPGCRSPPGQGTRPEVEWPGRTTKQSSVRASQSISDSGLNRPAAWPPQFPIPSLSSPIPYLLFPIPLEISARPCHRHRRTRLFIPGRRLDHHNH